MATRLSALQARILETLAGLSPPWAVTGGAALAGFHLQHRTTRDLDLFWHDRSELGDIAGRVRTTLAAAGIDAQVVQRTPAFVRFRATAAGETVVVDLVADPVPTIEPPRFHDHAGTRILVDTPHEILVNKVCALFSRSELRDLEDVIALRKGGGDLERALKDAPAKDAGFSPIMLAWILEAFPMQRLAAASGHRPEEIERMDAERLALGRAVAAVSDPGR